jgi:hypothetical protein
VRSTEPCLSCSGWVHFPPAAFVTHALRFNKLPDGADSSSAAGGKASEWTAEWKILVLDASSRRVLAHLFPVSELRKMGATLHLSLEAHRDEIPGVPAVYMITVSH